MKKKIEYWKISLCIAMLVLVCQIVCINRIFLKSEPVIFCADQFIFLSLVQTKEPPIKNPCPDKRAARNYFIRNTEFTTNQVISGNY